MATSDTPPVGLDHPTVALSPAPSSESHPGASRSDEGRSDECACADCEYATEIDGDLPEKCPDCGGALTRPLD